MNDPEIPKPSDFIREIIAKDERLLAGKPLFHVGNYFRVVAIEDCASRSLSEFRILKSVCP